MKGFSSGHYLLYKIIVRARSDGKEIVFPGMVSCRLLAGFRLVFMNAVFSFIFASNMLRNVSGFTGFRRKASANVFVASRLLSCSGDPVKTILTILGERSPIRRIRSVPSISGSLTSINVASKLLVLTFSHASLPVLAVETKKPLFSRTRVNTRKMEGSSSIKRIFGFTSEFTQSSGFNLSKPRRPRVS